MSPDGIQELFSSFGPVSVRRMFGGAGIYADGIMIAIVVDGTIYLKTDEKNAPDFEREGLGSFTYTAKNGKRAVMSYRRMPDRLYDDPDELVGWARGALSAAKRSAGRKNQAAGKAKSRQSPRQR